MYLGLEEIIMMKVTCVSLSLIVITGVLIHINHLSGLVKSTTLARVASVLGFIASIPLFLITCLLVWSGGIVFEPSPIADASLIVFSFIFMFVLVMMKLSITQLFAISTFFMWGIAISLS